MSLLPAGFPPGPLASELPFWVSRPDGRIHLLEGCKDAASWLLGAGDLERGEGPLFEVLSSPQLCGCVFSVLPSPWQRYVTLASSLVALEDGLSFLGDDPWMSLAFLEVQADSVCASFEEFDMFPGVSAHVASMRGRLEALLEGARAAARTASPFPDRVRAAAFAQLVSGRRSLAFSSLDSFGEVVRDLDRMLPYTSISSSGGSFRLAAHLDLWDGFLSDGGRAGEVLVLAEARRVYGDSFPPELLGAARMVSKLLASSLERTASAVLSRPDVVLTLHSWQREVLSSDAAAKLLAEIVGRCERHLLPDGVLAVRVPFFLAEALGEVNFFSSPDYFGSSHQGFHVTLMQWSSLEDELLSWRERIELAWTLWCDGGGVVAASHPVRGDLASAMSSEAAWQAAANVL